jgi:mannose-6-phosphate isomerase-like protein (cupin superfamily)
MSARRTARAIESPTHSELEKRLRDAGLEPHWWSNEPLDRYGWHEHPYHKVLYCLSGDITFHADESDFALGPGDRLDVEPGTRHAATVGPNGVVCVEGWSDRS